MGIGNEQIIHHHCTTNHCSRLCAVHNTHRAPALVEAGAGLEPARAAGVRAGAAAVLGAEVAHGAEPKQGQSATRRDKRHTEKEKEKGSNPFPSYLTRPIKSYAAESQGTWAQ